MQALPKALFIVMLELTVGSFVSLYLLDLRRDTSRGFVVFQGVLYMLFAGLTLLAMNAFATPELVRGYGLDAGWLRAQGPLALTFSLLMVPWNVLLWRDRSPRMAKKSAKTVTDVPLTGEQKVRHVVGALTSLLGLAALFAVGMAYRPLADSRLGGAFVVLAFLAGGIAIGGVMTAMLLGHWYLNTPTASGKPLEFTTALLLGALALELCFSLLMGPSTAHAAPGAVPIAPGTTIQVNGGQLTVTTPTPLPAQQAAQAAQAEQARVAPLGAGAMLWLQFLMGFLAPLTLGGIALYLTRGRSFQSATGMLYLCVAFIFIGEVIGRGLLLTPIS
jgi:hypothetical protein